MLTSHKRRILSLETLECRDCPSAYPLTVDTSLCLGDGGYESPVARVSSINYSIGTKVSCSNNLRGIPIEQFVGNPEIVGDPEQFSTGNPDTASIRIAHVNYF